MIKYKTLLGIACISLLWVASTGWVQNNGADNQKIFTQMFNAIKQVKTARYNLYSNERFPGKYIQGSFAIKVNASPYKVYTKDIKKGIEVLWVQGTNGNKAIVNPNGFPYVNVHLDPAGNNMHKEQHQTIDKSGYAYIGDLLYNSLAQYPDAYTKYVISRSDTTWQGYPCYQEEISVPGFHYYNYTLKNKGETVMSIANKFHLCDYLILSTNDISSYEDQLDMGKQLSIPSSYSKYTFVTIRKDNNLPVHIKIYDDKGLLEDYSFTNVQVNCPIQDAEFTEKYPDYHF